MPNDINADEVAIGDALLHSEQFRRIVDYHIPRFLAHQAEKSLDYEDGANVLGIRGQYADLNRKMIKLRRAMWDGKELKGEPLEEVLLDLIGHCFLTLEMLDDEAHIHKVIRKMEEDEH